MSILNHRVAKLEAELLKVRFSDLSDDELRAYSASLPFKHPKQYEAIIHLINRHGSAFPIIDDDTARAVLEADSNMKESQHANT